jgi:hypothetical protein
MASRWTAKAGTFRKVTPSTRPSRTSAWTSIRPAGDSRRKGGDRLDDRDHPGLDQDGDHADRVGPGHRRVFDLLHDHVAGVGAGDRGRQDQVAVGRRVASRLAQHQLAQVIGVIAQMGHLVEHRGARDVEDAAGDHPAGLARRVGIDRGDHPVEAHGCGPG